MFCVYPARPKSSVIVSVGSSSPCVVIVDKTYTQQR